MYHSDGFWYINTGGTLPVTVAAGSSPDEDWICVGVLEFYPTNYALNFGVADTGDMTERVSALHAYCNYSGEEAVYRGVKSFSIDSTADILVSSSVDFSGAVYEPIKTQTLPAWEFIPTFRISDPEFPAELVEGINTSSLQKGSSSFTPDSLFPVDGVVCFDTDINFGKRYPTDSGYYKLRQVFKVYCGGQLQRPLDLLIGGGSIGTTYYRKSSGKFITINNLIIDAASDNQLQAMIVERNQVNINNIFVIHSDGYAAKQNIREVITINKCCDIFIDRLMANGNQETNSGSYILSGEFIAELHISKCGVETGMPSIGFNTINGVYVIDSCLNRFDWHAWMHNVFTRNLSLGAYGLSFGVGGGLLQMRDTISYKGHVTGRGDVTSASMRTFATVVARNDYGGIFYGSIDIDGVKIIIDKTLDWSAGTLAGPWTMPVLSFEANGDYGFTEKKPVGYTIQVKNVIWSVPAYQYYFDLIAVNYGWKSITSGVLFPTSVIVDGLYTDQKGAGKWNLIPLIPHNYSTMYSEYVATETGGNCRILIDKVINDYGNVRDARYTTIPWYVLTSEQSDVYRVIPNITISNSLSIHVSMTINGSITKITSSEIRDLRTTAGSASTCIIYLNGCEIRFLDGAFSSLGRSHVRGGYLYRQSSSSGGVQCGTMLSSQGLIVDASVNIQNGGVSSITKDTLFSGWKP
ncbi:TPA: hypothetical protein VGT10_001970 [Enterobacter cloacae]|nr:hypothetical protein [Enterobacter cloacae]